MKQISFSSLEYSLKIKDSAHAYTDETLMSRFQDGDEFAYIELVNRYRDKLNNFIYYFLGDIEIAEDIVQDTMIKLYQKKHYYKEIAKFSTWIYTIAKNLANSELRKKKRRRNNKSITAVDVLYVCRVFSLITIVDITSLSLRYTGLNF